MLKLITYRSGEPGPRFLVLGAVHGNEKCGTLGIRRVIEDIDAGTMTIKSGCVTFIPICNPKAYAHDVRFTERNLNRYLVPMEKPNCYEAEIGNILCAAIEDCDVLLDIHSYTVGGAPFALIDPQGERDYAFAASLGDYATVIGWEDAYRATGRQTVSAADANEAIGTTNYARRHNALAVTVECGQHQDPSAPEVAYKTVRNALRFLTMTDEKSRVTSQRPAQVIKMQKVFYRDDTGTFSRPWKNLEPVYKNQPIAYRADGAPIAAAEDSLIIMPKAGAAVGEEWFYLGTEKTG